MGNVLKWNDSTVCGGRMCLKMFVRNLYDRWKSLESESVIIISVPLVFWVIRDTSFLIRAHPNHKANV